MRDIVPIPLYHATFAAPPADLAQRLHNVTPDELYRQLTWLREHFDVVGLDELLDDYAPGKTAVTFDDGYLCVFDEALPVLRELNIPATMFLNGFALAGRPFWRDKVRAVISSGLEAAFADFAMERVGLRLKPTAKGVYRGTKAPDGPSSRLVEGLVDDFLRLRGVAVAGTSAERGADTFGPEGLRAEALGTNGPDTVAPGQAASGGTAASTTRAGAMISGVAGTGVESANTEAPVYGTGHCARTGQLPDEPLLTYGNHSRSHYVLSTLSRQEQRDEILGMQAELEALGLPLSRVFSIPFGADADFNQDTLEVLHEAGLRAALSRNRIGGVRPTQLGNVLAVERFVAPPTLEGLQQRIAEG